MSHIPTQVWIPDSPYSSDPLDFDFLIHHIVFYSIYSPLVTEYKAGQVVGMIAESWDSNSNFTTWNFRVRPNLRFENGDAITAEIVLSSLKRIFFILNQRKSQNGVVENIKGIEQFNNISNPLAGLTLNLNNNTIVFSFTKPIKNFLSLISFGMYSIVHPSQYAIDTGIWNDSKKTISSAAYKITDWSKDNITLTLRTEYISPFSISKNSSSIPQISINWDKNQKVNSEITYGTSDEDFISDNKNFFGGTISEIRFVRCLSYYVSNSICHKLENRRFMRDEFYKHLTSIGFKPIKSFFPLIMEGITEITNSKYLNIATNETNDYKIRTFSVNETNAVNPVVVKGYKSGMDKIAKSINSLVEYKTVATSNIYEDIELQPKEPAVDICSNVSGIYIDKPQDDVQFMFKAKEGVMLPDTDGRILKELENENVDLQKVNELLWDQAVIWPLTHYGIGFWAPKNKFDFSEINLSRTPTMFELIKLK